LQHPRLWICGSQFHKIHILNLQSLVRILIYQSSFYRGFLLDLFLISWFVPLFQMNYKDNNEYVLKNNRDGVIALVAAQICFANMGLSRKVS